ncbi:hypothetical protein DHD05_00315 [Arenibacter sp. N53]|uniref:hypothetical protein n=1 Tax=Arenibacter TaxID=178469 RepID=UPI000CD478D9|nr:MULTISPECIES: hypothetical protein [Arenibacter]MCM4150021.1 hypothetical protein [Arenibacter sp. N53]
MKNTFINNEIWMLTYGASFQRAYAYTENASEVTKGYFKNMTSGLINNMLDQYKKGNVSDDQHIENIEAVRDNSRNFSEIFTGGEINFGISQKILNLYLKYQWCLGNIPEPPHFPVDRIIQQKLNRHVENTTMVSLQIEPWTRFKDETHYLKVINFSRELAKLDSSVHNLTPANIELTLFQRR